jgi:hypothetical protein
VAALFTDDEGERVADLEAETGKRVRIEPDASLAPGSLRVRAAAPADAAVA